MLRSTMTLLRAYGANATSIDRVLAPSGIKFEASSYSEPGALHPWRVIAWSSFPKDATRFTFAE